jgi:hypothetical protein
MRRKTVTIDTASYDRSWPVAGDPPSISFGITLVMAIACGVAAANIYYNQPMLGIMEAAFPGRVAVVGLVPTATQLGFAAGLLLLVPLGDRLERRRLILIQLAALTLSLAAAALAPDAWSLVLASTLVGVTSSVAQQIVPFAAELGRTQSSRRDHRNRNERPTLRNLVGPRPWRRHWRPLWLARHVLARLAHGDCGGLVVGGGLTPKSPQDAGGLRNPA